MVYCKVWFPFDNAKLDWQAFTWFARGFAHAYPYDQLIRRICMIYNKFLGSNKIWLVIIIGGNYIILLFKVWPPPKAIILCNNKWLDCIDPADQFLTQIFKPPLYLPLPTVHTPHFLESNILFIF